jgi:transcriptional regulator
MTATPNDFLYGSLDLMVLRAISVAPAHGYTISNFIRQRGDGDLDIVDAALYKALHRLERQGLVRSSWGLSANNRSAKFYALTPSGRRQLQARTEVWRRFVGAVERVLAPVGGAA